MKNYFLGIIFTSVGLLSFGKENSFKRISKTDYIDQWKGVAVQNMIQFGIPASITMAQGILESGFGNSELAREANNHFGIKCHKSWDGKRYFYDDDRKNECFRKYKSAAESFQDHSNFLTSYSRYDFLFDLSKTDYKSWARGLKKAGYATNPKYAKLIIETIEENNLAALDELGSSPYQNIEIEENNTPLAMSPQSAETLNALHTVKTHTNNIKYVVAKKGDTFYRIAKEFELGLWQLYRYNDFEKHKDVLVPGDIVYLQPKRFRSKGNKNIVLKQDESLLVISQQQGIRLKSLMKMNEIASENAVLTAGSRVILKR